MKKNHARLFGLLLVFAAGPGLAATTGLEAALRAALSQHPALAGKRGEVAAKGYAVDTAKAQRYPTLSGQATNRDDTTNANTNPVTLRGRLPVWAFGRIDSGIAYANADLTADQADLFRIQRQLLDQTSVAYVQVQGTHQRLVIAQENVASLTKLYEQIQRRERGELASVADVRLALARLTQARALQQRYEGELAVAKTELRALTQTVVEADEPVPEALTRLPDAATLEALAWEQSADLRLKQRQVELAQADVERERTAAMPTVYVQADRYFNQPYYGQNVRMSVVLEGSLEGMGFAAAGRSKAAVSRQRAAEEDLNATRVDLERTVQSLETNRRVQKVLLESQGVSVSELAGILASYQRQYEAGSKSWLDLLNMQRELSDERFQQAQAQTDWLVYSLKLAALTGQLDALVFSENDR
ncbi:TolC family protein [Ideonella oryzae]|uniref:TolC family protein n=1 Tax=Ideonella oryzae TaxID=2937441 RepID=A0ABT1BJA5_9BURK|nr:TolC family protein [Ideonella oryzae]MCO5976178.1 TolC family protein [Ideonella oryzae]